MSKRRPHVMPPHAGTKGACCWCGGALTGRQRAWCGKTCVDAYLLAKGDQTRARALLHARDGGTCAICRTTPEQRKAAGGLRCWDADHVVPIAEGGALALSNLRTLCQPCHRQVTRELAVRLAAARRLNGLLGPSKQ